jgi:alpha-N-acetylglucosamine transferase
MMQKKGILKQHTTQQRTYCLHTKNTKMKIYNFRSCKQKESQTLDDFVTELRTLAKNWEFNYVDRESLQQVIQNCRSNRLRRRALREPDKNLTDILVLVRTFELSDTQANIMEKNKALMPYKPAMTSNKQCQ